MVVDTNWGLLFEEDVGWANCSWRVEIHQLVNGVGGEKRCCCFLSQWMCAWLNAFEHRFAGKEFVESPIYKQYTAFTSWLGAQKMFAELHERRIMESLKRTERRSCWQKCLSSLKRADDENGWDVWVLEVQNGFDFWTGSMDMFEQQS